MRLHAHGQSTPGHCQHAVQQYGFGSIDVDADDILALAQYLHKEHACKEWVLAGHSTGTQDAVRFVQRHGVQAEGTAPLRAVVLLAPVRTRPVLPLLLPGICAPSANAVQPLATLSAHSWRVPSDHWPRVVTMLPGDGQAPQDQQRKAQH